MRETIRKQQKIIEELTRSPRKLKPSQRGGGAATPADESFVVPKGAKILQRDKQGRPTAFELPPIMRGEDWDSQEWRDFDWDDLYDDYGDEEEDQYTEDAG